MSSHGLSRSQASQVVQGKLCLDKVVHRRQRRAHLDKYLGHCTFEKAARDGRPRLFALHGQQVQLMRIKANRVYEVDYLLLGPDLRPSGEMSICAQAAVQAGRTWVDHMPKIQTSISLSRSESRVVAPIPKLQDRYFISDKKLFGWVNAGNTLCVKTLEGEMVKGTPQLDRTLGTRARRQRRRAHCVSPRACQHPGFSMGFPQRTTDISPVSGLGPAARRLP